MNVTLYHNPRCSKSRNALALLQEQCPDNLEIIDYLKTPLTADKLNEICNLLGCDPIKIIRQKESKFTELGLNKIDIANHKVFLNAIAENPILLERPIVVVDNKKATIGRPTTDSIIQLIK